MVVAMGPKNDPMECGIIVKWLLGVRTQPELCMGTLMQSWGAPKGCTAFTFSHCLLKSEPVLLHASSDDPANGGLA